MPYQDDLNTILKCYNNLIFLKMSEIESIQKEIIEEFSFFEDWTQRYEYMIELGKALPLIDKRHRTEENIIKGCQSKVWIHANLEGDKVKFTADSDAIITKGIIAILIRVFSKNSSLSL